MKKKPAALQKAIFSPLFSASDPATVATMPNPIVPPRRMRPYSSLLSPSIDIVALFDRGMIGEKKILKRIATANNNMNVLSVGRRTSPRTTASNERLMMSPCLFVRSASPVINGTLTSVISGVIPTSRPICAPVKDSDW
jgi:hypothetical protein